MNNLSKVSNVFEKIDANGAVFASTVSIVHNGTNSNGTQRYAFTFSETKNGKVIRKKRVQSNTENVLLAAYHSKMASMFERNFNLVNIR